MGEGETYTVMWCTETGTHLKEYSIPLYESLGDLEVVLTSAARDYGVWIGGRYHPPRTIKWVEILDEDHPKHWSNRDD